MDCANENGESFVQEAESTMGPETMQNTLAEQITLPPFENGMEADNSNDTQPPTVSLSVEQPSKEDGYSEETIENIAHYVEISLQKSRESFLEQANGGNTVNNGTPLQHFCPFCGIAYNDWKVYVDHIKLHDVSSNDCCNDCQADSITITVHKIHSSLKEASLATEEVNNNPNVCKLCGKTKKPSTSTLFQQVEGILGDLKNVEGSLRKSSSQEEEDCRKMEGQPDTTEQNNDFNCVSCGECYYDFDQLRDHLMHYCIANGTSDVGAKSKKMLTSQEASSGNTHIVKEFECMICCGAFREADHFINCHVPLEIRNSRRNLDALKAELKIKGVCYHCGKIYSSDSPFLIKHIQMHFMWSALSKRQSTKFSCVSCSKAFKTYNKLENHRQNGCSSLNIKASLSDDGHEADDVNLQSPSAVAEDSDAALLYCKMCGKNYKSREVLRTHILRTHFYQCEECGKRFSTVAKLSEHVTNSHPYEF